MNQTIPPNSTSNNPPTLKIHHYAFFLLLYFLLVKSLFFLLHISVPTFIPLLYALLLTSTIPLRKYLLHRAQKQYQYLLQNNPHALSKLLHEKKFQKLISPTLDSSTIITQILILLNLTFFLLTILHGGSENVSTLAAFGAKITPLIWHGKEYWRLINANFLHIGTMHLLMNLTILWLFGTATEKIYGHLRYLIIYLLSGILGVLTSTLFLPNLPGAGASGALFGIVASFIVLAFRYKSYIPLRYQDLYTWIILLYMALEFSTSLFVNAIDVYAHLGGFLTGAIASYLLNISPKIAQTYFPPAPHEPSWKTKFIQINALLLALTLPTSFILNYLNNPQPYYASLQQWKNYHDPLMGVSWKLPANWRTKYLYPGSGLWISPLGHRLYYQCDKSTTQNLYTELQHYLWLFLTSPPTAPILPQLSFLYHKPPILTTTLTLPTTPPVQFISAIQNQNLVYYFTFQFYQPHKVKAFYYQFLQQLQFSTPASLEKLSQHLQPFLKQKNPHLLNFLAYQLAKEGKYLHLATQYAKQALQLVQKKTGKLDPAILDTLAELHFQQGNPQKAIQLIQQALQTLPNNLYFQYQLQRFQQALAYLPIKESPQIPTTHLPK